MSYFKKYFIVILGFLLISGLTILKIFYNLSFYSDAILAVTALVVVWYTFETSLIRKSEYIIAEANKESQNRFRSPIVNLHIFTNENDRLDTRIRITNLSNYAVAVRLNCNIKIDEEELSNFSPAYDGRDYWNLQYGESKEGHFSWFDLLKHKELISETEAEDIKKEFVKARDKIAVELYATRFDFKPPRITMDVEVFCENEMRLSTYYPPVHYDYNFKRRVWIPVITSAKPYWEFLPG